MILDVYVKQVTRVSDRYPRGRRTKVTYARVCCDHCRVEFERERKKIQKDFHFCGVDCLNESQRAGVLERKKSQMFVERYGVTSPAKNREVIERTKKTNLEKYGVEWATQTNDVQAKRVATTLKRHGVRNVLNLQTVKQSANSQHACKKRFETMKTKGSFRTSLPEERAYILLVDHFGIDDVVRQFTPEGTRWPVDFYVKSLDVYIQIDGEYWHGICSPGTGPRAESIRRKMESDKRQDAWFQQTERILVRYPCRNSSDVDRRLIEQVIASSERKKRSMAKFVEEAVK